MGAHVFRKGLMRTMTDIQAAEIHSYGQRAAFFHPARDSLHETPHWLAQTGRMGVGVGNDTAIIRLPPRALPEIPVRRWVSRAHKNQ